MSVSRKRPKRGRRRRFGLGIFLVAMTPSTIGYQDLAALIARQPAVAERWRQHTYPPAFSTFRTATFSFPRPVGTLIPSLPGYTFASLDPRSIDATGSIGRAGRADPFAEPVPTIVFPQVDRTRKGDLLAPRRPLDPPAPLPATAPAKPREDPKIQEALPKETPAAPVAAEPDLRRARSPEAGMRSAPRPDAFAGWPDREPRAFARTVLETPHVPQLATDFDPENPSGPRAEARTAESVEERGAVQAAFADWPNREPRGFGVPETVSAAAPQPEALALDYENPSGPTPDDQSSEPLVADYENPSGPAPAVPFIADLAPADQIVVAERPERSEGEPLRDENGIITDDEPKDFDFALSPMIAPDNPAVNMARLFFGSESFAPGGSGLKPWRDGEAPVLIPLNPAVDPDIKRAALDPEHKPVAPGAKHDGETIAPKGEVTGADKRPKSPAERLELTGAKRAKHERCLTNAIYFEARGESERGQMAVAQVVLNRVFSEYYPDNVCGVVYQNSHRRLACQFTFACDNVRDVVTEPEAWETAKRIARDTLDGKVWLPDIGKATHYHATYVHPWWVRTMKKHQKLGIHIFYRPKRWGDGADEWSWEQAAEITGSVKAANGKPSVAESRM